MDVTSEDLEKFCRVQDMAKSAMIHISERLGPGMTEKDIAKIALDYFTERGVTDFWYHGVPALVHVGANTEISVSGREYKPTGERIGPDYDVVTIDLGPTVEGYWGDFARTFVLVEGKIATETAEDMNPSAKRMIEGARFARDLHDFLDDFIEDPEMNFSELYELLDQAIVMNSYEILDFHGNFGHTIERNLQDRRFIIPGETLDIRGAGLFTFEPHIKKRGVPFGYKHEDIYYFSDGDLKKL